MSKNYTMIHEFYQEGNWGIDRVYNVVGKAAGITKGEYKKITGCTYPAKEKAGSGNKDSADG